MNEDTRTFLSVIGSAILMFVIMTSLVIGIDYGISSKRCSDIGGAYNLPSQYYLVARVCILTLPNGQRIDANKYIVYQPAPSK